MQIVVKNELYAWDEVIVKEDDFNKLVVIVDGAPAVANRRKHKRIPISNTCDIRTTDASVTAKGKMVNISAGGYAFSTSDKRIAEVKDGLVRIRIDDYAPLNGKEIDARIVRISENGGRYTFGCQTFREYKEVYTS